jgi:hypothetical protein
VNFNVEIPNNFRKRGNHMKNKGLEVLSYEELNQIRGGFTEDKTNNKEKDVYDTREI